MGNSLAGLAGAGAIVAVALLIASLGSVITYIIIVVANRADPDPTGKRPMAVYLFGGGFLTYWIAFIGAVVIVRSLVGLIGTNYGPMFTSEQHPIGDGAIRGVSAGLLFLVIGGAAHVLHTKRGLELAESETDPASPTKRVARSYVAVVSFVAVLIIVVATFALAYSVLALVAPGIYGAGARLATFKGLLNEVFVLGLGIFTFWLHQRLAPVPLRLLGTKSAAVVSDVVDVTP